jgi:tRNA threonylcarbamoyladenosine biosynthesis protein TsaB
MNDPIVLGIETSGILCSVAWWQNNQTLLEYKIEKRNAHATLLANLVEQGLKKLGLSGDSINMVAVGSGPGSFTGLRIGMAYAKGFCLGQDITLIPVTNFEVLAHHARDYKGPVLTLIEARKGYYYTGRFRYGSNIPEEQYLAEGSTLMLNIDPGSKIIVHEEIAPGTLIKSVPNSIPIEKGNYSSAVICAIGYQKYKQKDIMNLDDIEPLYLQPFAGVL